MNSTAAIRIKKPVHVHLYLYLNIHVHVHVVIMILDSVLMSDGPILQSQL